VRAVRIVQLANFYGPHSGGLRTAVHHLGAGYAVHGHEVVLVVPGPRHADDTMPNGVRRIALPGVTIPHSGGYRVVDPCRARALLRRLRPDRIEVSDRLTLRGWAGGPLHAGCPA
jgi:alpha-1,6-mannosyltransferase